MAGITSNVGLISGINTTDTIDKLIAIASRPKDLLTSRNAAAQRKQLAIGKLESLVLSLKTTTTELAKTDTFGAKQATSSSSQILAASVSTASTAIPGTYSFKSVQTAQSQQLISGGIASNTQPLGAGTVTFGFGGFADAGQSLSQLNGGNGVVLGKIKITDRSGSTGIVDLSYAQNVDDVLNAINSQSDINVRAVADGDHFKLIDTSGSTSSNLKVQEVSGGTTAASLGLASINTASSSATGTNIVQASVTESLGQLNNGNGLAIRQGLPDLQFSFRDGSAPLQIDLHSDQKLGDLINTINAADPTRLQVALSSDGNHLQFTDLTSGSGSFGVTSPLGGKVAEQLGLAGTSTTGSTLSSGRLNTGLKTALLGSLNGGAGLGTLGTISLTDRSGATANVNLASAETLDDVINSINGSGLGIKASYNNARNGIQLNDTTGATASNLIIANGDGTNSADKLQIAASKNSTNVNSGSLKLQTVSENTTLSSLNGGQGVGKNTLIFTDSAGSAATLDLRDAKFQTVGDVINGVNALGLGIKASINATGDGIQLTDTAGGALSLKVRDSGTASHGAVDLHISGVGTTQTVGGVTSQVINGANTQSVTLSSTDTLQDLVTKINGLKSNVSASSFSVGGGATPYRLSLSSLQSGAAGQLLVDTSALGISLNESIKGQDAVVAVGSGNILSGQLISSSSNTFTNVLPGVTLETKGTSTSPITVTVAQDTSGVASFVQKFVDGYNSLRSELDSDTQFNTDQTQLGVLFGSSTALSLDNALSSLISSRFTGAGNITTLGELGINLDATGKLTLDKTQLQSKLDSSPTDVQNFFTSAKNGFAVRFNALVDQVATGDASLLEASKKSLQDTIDTNQARIDQLQTRLDNQRTLLQNQFNNLEVTLAKIQSNQASLASLAQLAGITTSSSSSSSGS